MVQSVTKALPRSNTLRRYAWRTENDVWTNDRIATDHDVRTDVGRRRIFQGHTGGHPLRIYVVFQVFLPMRPSRHGTDLALHRAVAGAAAMPEFFVPHRCAVPGLQATQPQALEILNKNNCLSPEAMLLDDPQTAG